MPRILLIEDNPDNSETLSRRLRRRGFHVMAAFNGQEGVEMARQEKPDLVLMDMNMPVMDGWQATSVLRNEPETREVPIIGLTAHALTGDREKALAVGCNDYHTKPIEFDRLMNQIEVQLRSRGDEA